MKRIFTLLLMAGLMGQVAVAQKFFTRDGHISFFSKTPVEDIEAHNEKVTAVFDEATGAIEFAVLIKSFEFEKALMEEHFNENYMESNELPKATFKGTIEDFQGYKDSGFPPGVESAAHGKLTIHGVTKDVVIGGVILPTDDGGYHMTAKFTVQPEDYDIEIPNAVRDNIAKTITVTVDCELKPMNK